jgi:hypothetical protein
MRDIAGLEVAIPRRVAVSAGNCEWAARFMGSARSGVLL